MNLYLRLLRTLLHCALAPRRGLLDEARLSFRVWLNDCDLNLHLNNGRYLTFMDLGRVHLIAQMGLLRAIMRHRMAPVLGAAEITFIRPLAPFSRFDLVSRVLSWDDKYFYLEQRFEQNGRLCATGLVKGLFLRSGRPVPTREVVALAGPAIEPPVFSPALHHWRALTESKKSGPEAA